MVLPLMMKIKPGCRNTGYPGKWMSIMRVSSTQMRLIAVLFLGGWWLCASAAEPPGVLDFDDRPLQEPLTHPEWFKLSFLDLREDLADAAASQRKLAVYLGQKYCPYCEALLSNDFGRADIRDYTSAHFDVIGLDIHGDRTVTDLQGREMSEKAFADSQRVNFTPTLIFYAAGEGEVFRLRGYYPPYQFRAALEYVADEHYRQESFADYLARADVPMVFDVNDLNYEDFFASPPYLLARNRLPAEKPLLVIFEQPECHACDILHTGPFKDPQILRRLGGFEVVQLNLLGDTPVVTPDGERTRARDWAHELGLFYTPTLIFYDERGREIIRVDSVVQFNRLRNVLDYVLTKTYREYPTFQRWREAR